MNILSMICAFFQATGCNKIVSNFLNKKYFIVNSKRFLTEVFAKKEMGLGLR